MSLESAIAKLTAAVEANTAAIAETRSLTNQSQPPAPNVGSASASPAPSEKPAAAATQQVAPAAPVAPPAAAPAVAASPVSTSEALVKEAKELVTRCYSAETHNAILALLTKYGSTRAQDLAVAVLPQFIAEMKQQFVAAKAA